jgi:hypothetical protein
MSAETPPITKTTAFEAVPTSDVRLVASFAGFAPKSDVRRIPYAVLRTVIRVAGNKTEALHDVYAFTEYMNRAETIAAAMNEAIGS